MSKETLNMRLEAFCDGVFAIAITLLVIDIKIPSSAVINNSADLWRVIKHISPSILAFLLSFTIILITWVNHHNHMRLIHKSSASFLYANGVLLLTVALFPFPTSLLGEYIFTDHAAPSVVLYDGVLALQAVGWILICHTAIKNKLYTNEKALITLRRNLMFAYFACTLYGLCSLLAFWFPLTIATFTTLSWIFWIVVGINIKWESMVD
jgi:uncharacterized membrane protein